MANIPLTHGKTMKVSNEDEDGEDRAIEGLNEEQWQYAGREEDGSNRDSDRLSWLISEDEQQDEDGFDSDNDEFEDALPGFAMLANYWDHTHLAAFSGTLALGILVNI